MQLTSQWRIQKFGWVRALASLLPLPPAAPIPLLKSSCRPKLPIVRQSRFLAFQIISSWLLLLVKLLKHNQNYYLKTRRFDLYQRPSSEEAGTQFFRFLTQRENAVSRKRSYAWLSW